MLPCPTPTNALHPNFFNFFSSYTVIFNPYFLNLINLFTYSSGCKIFPGSETKSLVRNTPDFIASLYLYFFSIFFLWEVIILKAVFFLEFFLFKVLYISKV